MTRKGLLLCGAVASLLYLGTDISASMLYTSMLYKGHCYTAQAVSELSSIGSPTRHLVVPLFLLHGVLQVAFGFGVANGLISQVGFKWLLTF